uniref:Fatty acid synthase n=2 Tax=Aceria tosichella TaxID=561515 RepID=A0A6G1SKN2_9ACAR
MKKHGSKDEEKTECTGRQPAEALSSPASSDQQTMANTSQAGPSSPVRHQAREPTSQADTTTTPTRGPPMGSQTTTTMTDSETQTPFGQLQARQQRPCPKVLTSTTTTTIPIGPEGDDVEGEQEQSGTGRSGGATLIQFTPATPCTPASPLAPLQLESSLVFVIPNANVMQTTQRQPAGLSSSAADDGSRPTVATTTATATTSLMEDREARGSPLARPDASSCSVSASKSPAQSPFRLTGADARGTTSTNGSGGSAPPSMKSGPGQIAGRIQPLRLERIGCSREQVQLLSSSQEQIVPQSDRCEPLSSSRSCHSMANVSEVSAAPAAATTVSNSEVGGGRSSDALTDVHRRTESGPMEGGASSSASSSGAAPTRLDSSQQQQQQQKQQQQQPPQPRPQESERSSSNHTTNNTKSTTPLTTDTNNRPQPQPQQTRPITATSADTNSHQLELQAHLMQQQQREAESNVKQFSDKSLHELADYYLNLEPADIPDTGFVVSGIAGRFPNADNLNELWDNLKNGRDMVLGPDDKRWPLGLWDLPKKAARIKDISRFDNEFFGITKECADYTDHQLRNLYEVIYESILDAGMSPSQVRGDRRCGIFFGFHTSETENEFYEKPHFKTTGYQAQLLTAVTNYFDIQGVAGSYDAACASSFAAFHQAVLNLKAGLIDTAIVCGVNISVRPGTAYQFLLLQMLSPTGSSKFLDASADGYAKTEACVSVILTRADLAKRSYAAIVHTKCNNDGFKVEGITYPSSQSQEELMNEAIIEAGVDPRQIFYVEAHGTGTPAGDPEEARAIAKVYCQKRDEPLLIGSVKSNLGHAEGVSGLCSLAKVICTFENEILPMNLHYKKPNPNIQPLVEGRLKPVDQNIPFKHNLIPMNCYGFGGVNVHGIFKTHTRAIDRGQDYNIAPEFPRLVTMFGRSQAAIEYAFEEFKKSGAYGDSNKRLLTRDYLALLDSINECPIDKLMIYRGYMLLDNDLNEISSSIVQMNGSEDFQAPGMTPAIESSTPDKTVLDGQVVKNDKIIMPTTRPAHYQLINRTLWYILPGLGCQWKAMGKNLMKFKPIWSTIEKLAEVLKPLGVDLVDTLTNNSRNVYDKSVVNLFTGIVAVQIALIDLLTLLEARPAGIIGHSIGEISCAYADGLLTATETILLAYHLAKPIDDAGLHGGAMAAASLGYRQAENYLEQFVQRQKAKKGASSERTSVEIACINGDESITLSGSREEIDDFVAMLTEENIYARHVADVRTAFHNSSLKSIEKELVQSVQKLFNNNNIQRKSADRFKSKNWYSTLYGQTKQQGNGEKQQFEINAQYYVDNLCSPVQFRDAMNNVEPTENILIEIGPHGLFHPILKQKYLTKLKYVTLMKRMDGSVESVLNSLGQLYQLGQPLKLANLYPKVEFPVAKGTGSVSSIIRWNHHQKFHVAKYPEAFRKPPCEARVKFDLIDESDKYLAGHCVDGRILFPATGYLHLVWRSFSLTKDKVGDSPLRNTGEAILVPVEFTNVRLYRATILGSAPVELLVRIEEATGQFEVREGGSVVADGYIAQPRENPDGLMYEHIKEHYKTTEMTLKTDDVYKQFRVCGYDYGESFRNIVEASSDGLHVRVKWSGQFIPFSDSVLQSLFLAICKKTSALFLPTKFEYMRINPKMLQAKVDAAAAEEKPCILDAYCELETGIIVTDGIEMRGVGASPAPRRNQQDPVLEAYQFVPNVEHEINDRLAEPSNLKVEQYMEMCSTAAYKILSNLQQSKSQIAATMMDGFNLVDDVNLNKYMDENEQSEHHVLMQILDKILAAQEEPAEKQVSRGGLEGSDEKAKQNEATAGEDGKPAPVVAKTGPSRERKPNPKLRSISELQKQFERLVKQEFEELQTKLGYDLMSSTFARERFLRPLLEIVFENTPSQKVKLLELNPGYGIKYDAIANITGEILPHLSINYFLGHPETGKIPSSSLPQDTKLYTWTPASKQLQRELLDIDLIVYNDTSLYPFKKDQFTCERVKTEDEVASSEAGTEKEKLVLKEDVSAIFESACEALRPNGFLLALARTRLAPAEKFLYKVGDYILDSQTMERRELIAKAARSCNAQGRLQLVGEKTDKFGCCLMLFRKLDNKINLAEQNLLHIEHGKHANWLEPLKMLMNDVKSKSASESVNKNIWLIANDSVQSGLVGMFNCIRKEPGGERVRFILDQRKQSSYKLQRERREFEKIVKVKKEDSDEVEEIREPTESDAFINVQSLEADESNKLLVELIKQDLTYNCIDLDGRYGAYRHFTISELLENQKVKTTEAYVNVATRGDLSSFRWYEAPYRHIEPELRQNNMISIYYSSLNFRDIMLASGRLPLDALPVSIALSDCILGLEYSGVMNGKRVAGMISGRGIATTAMFKEMESIQFKLPDTMSLEEGASIPVVYATAVFAIVQRGRAQPGETILIHSGSGGVGQAAIRLCLHLGLTVYTTVGNTEKREFLKQEFPQLTDGHIFNSRDCSFETDVMRATNGRGVDLVLNSLSEDKLQASVRCLADGGRFLEIGKYDMALNNPVELMLLDTNKTFHGILLDKLFDLQTLTPVFDAQRTQLVDIIERGLVEGYIKPIKRTIFDKTQVEDAFRFMASGKHIGKVVIKIRDEEYDTSQKGQDGRQLYKLVKPYPIYIEAQPRSMFDPNMSYIITGGLGGFGLELTKWMAANGGRHFVLTSRSGIKTGYQELVVDRLRENGVQVSVSSIDNNTDEGAEQLIREAQKLAPLGGIFNLAMVLKDSLLENATVEDFDAVFAPKGLGVAALDRAARKLVPDLQLFVAFSSVSCGKGNAGQVNYGYSNSVMERICEQRRRDGQHGLAIQWGAIGDVGVAFENLGGNEAVIGGTIPQRMPSCFATLSKFLASPFPVCLSILQADRRSFSAGKKGDLVKTILHVLGIKDPSTVDPNCTLGELGLDSLMAVEIRQALEREYDIVLTVQEIRGLTINRIREIGDGEMKKASSGEEANNQGVAAATDELGAGTGTAIYKTENETPLTSLVPGISVHVASNGTKSFVIDKNIASKPPLVLPAHDLILLNGDNGIPLNGNPIFCLPPIQGDFTRLAVVAKKFSRPCVGICWTNKMAQFSNINDAVKEHVGIIRQYYPTLKQLDLIGYSFGAAMAFEIMVHVQQNKLTPIPLNPGKLVLLDGSPDAINIGVRYITNTLTDAVDETARAAEVMTVFLMQHSRFDYADLKRQILQNPTNEQKLMFATNLLAKALGLKDSDSEEQLSKAIEAYCRRFQIMLNYKFNQEKLHSDVTLIRATEVYVGTKDGTVDPDYGLTKMVSGRVNSCLLKGNHESFLDDNIEQVGSLLQDIICPVMD